MGANLTARCYSVAVNNIVLQFKSIKLTELVIIKSWLFITSLLMYWTRMGHAASLVKDISQILKNAQQTLTTNRIDATLKNELTSLRSKAQRVLEFPKVTEAKRKMWKSLRMETSNLWKGRNIGPRKAWRRRNGKKNQVNYSSILKFPNSDLQNDSPAVSNNNENLMRTKPTTGQPVFEPKKVKNRNDNNTPYSEMLKNSSSNNRLHEMSSVSNQSGNSKPLFSGQNASSTPSSNNSKPIDPGQVTVSTPSGNNNKPIYPGQIAGSISSGNNSKQLYPTVAWDKQLPHPKAAFSPKHHHEHSHLPHGKEELHQAGHFVPDEEFIRELHAKHIKHHGDGLEHFNGQFYDTRGLQKILEECKDCVVSSVDSKCPLKPDVMEMKKWASKMEQVLSSGCPKAASCQEPGSCCINVKSPFKRTVIMVTHMLKDVYNMFQEECNKGCKVDGKWSSWSSWSSCSVSCENGTQVRTRQCSNPSATSCGQPCLGDGKEYKNCVSGKCPCVDGNWASWGLWSSCSKTCGNGMKVRKRQCSNPPATSCGRPCFGVGHHRRLCSTQRCGPECVDGNWGGWQSWTSCSATCGQGTMTRQRACDEPMATFCGKRCHGMSSDFAFCSAEPVNGNWNTWSSWSICPVTCGPGVIERTRMCSNPRPDRCGEPCEGSDTERSWCYNTPCASDAPTWTTWNSWEPCNCHTAIRARTRQCVMLSSRNVLVNEMCPGSSDDQEKCDVEACCPENDDSPEAYSTVVSDIGPQAMMTNEAPGCIKTCMGLKPGRYPSCNNCTHYVVCNSSGELTEQQCRRRKEWDDARKKCLPRTSTCVGGRAGRFRYP